MTTVKIYAIINPITKAVIYIGASKNPKTRLIQHYYLGAPKKFPKRTLEVQKLKSDNTLPELLILEEVEYENVRFYEEFYIDLFKSWGFNLSQMNKSGYQKNKIRLFPGQIVYVPCFKTHGIVRNIEDVYIEVLLNGKNESDYFHNKNLRINYE